MSSRSCGSSISRLPAEGERQADYFYSDTDVRTYEEDISDLYEPFNFFGFAGMGISCKLKGSLMLHVLPTFRWGLLDTMEGPIDQKLWSAGVDFGLLWRW